MARLGMMVAIASVALAACGSDAPTTASEARATTPSTTQPRKPPVLDPDAARLCPEELRGLRLDSNNLTHGFDTTAGTTLDAAVRRGFPREQSPLAKLAPSTPVVLCWYTDVTFTPPAGRGTPSTGGGAVLVFVEGEARIVQSVSGAPERPR